MNTWARLVLIASILMLPSHFAVAADREVFQSPDLPAGLPFSAAVRAGDMIYLSGALGNVRGEVRLVDGGIGPETRQALTYIKENLERAGSSLDRVVNAHH